MTGQQILTADVLDILFEHRNKMYGAYQLRRTYHRRVWHALLFTFLTIVLLLLLLSAKGKRNILPLQSPDHEVVLRVIEQTPTKLIEPPPAQTAPKLPAARTQFNQIVIKPDVDVHETVPSQDVVADHLISDVTTTGTTGNDLLPPTDNGSAGNAAMPAPEPEKIEAPSYTAPQFPGGAEAWMRFLSRNLLAPEGLQEGEKKSVLIRFIVSADGSITQYEVVKSGGALFDGEVIRVLKKMPKWKPALKNGQPVTVTFTQPVTFVQQED